MNKQIKYLEMIQGIINRLACNSFIIKGWGITVSLAGFGLFVENKNKPVILAVVIFAALIFWILDTYYLKREKLFRKLYDDVAGKQAKSNASSHLFSMNITKYQQNDICFFSVMFSFPINLIYISLILMAIGLFYYLK